MIFVLAAEKLLNFNIFERSSRNIKKKNVINYVSTNKTNFFKRLFYSTQMSRLFSFFFFFCKLFAGSALDTYGIQYLRKAWNELESNWRIDKVTTSRIPMKKNESVIKKSKR